MYGVEFREMDDLLQESDFVTLHVNLTDETRGMINARTLGLMKPTAILINTARGPIVDPDDLYDALVNGEIAYAALDVTDPEPIAVDRQVADPVQLHHRAPHRQRHPHHPHRNGDDRRAQPAGRSQ